ncbi:hypothetical protein [Agrobacterium sp. ST15.13.015]|uniref:hypothetical protein n=1 Tax=Agrobacterium sp. ST15.13.015 TaxID=3017319 RepID=UPI0022C0521F|nr:hypothetical protein [Agrobacterium sp. ST15.13.015]MCZ7501994.1 hypothetical protein [Rhizobium rhizogenes]
MPSAFSTTNTQEADDPTEIIIRLRNCEKQIDQSTREFRRDVNRLITGLLTIAIISASFLFVGMPKAERMALIDQENFHVARR